MASGLLWAILSCSALVYLKTKYLKYIPPETLDFGQFSFDNFIMMTSEPLLKIYADKQAAHLALKKMERSTKSYGFITLLFAIASVYVVLNQIEDIKFLTLLLFVISTGMTWFSYKSIPSYLRILQELPLLYSFYPHGFISHLGEQEYSWEHISTLHYSKTNINLKLMDNPHKMAEVGFVCISQTSLNSVLSHFKTYAPERLSNKIEF